MIYPITVTLLLGAGFAACVLAQRRDLAPSLPTALAAGVALRVTAWYLAAAQSWEPFDFKYDFPAAAAAVLHHHDPMLSARARGWPFLPTMAYVLATELKLGQITHLPWRVVGRLAPVLADLLLIPLVGMLARRRGPLRRFQYACNPIAVMVCAIHGQLEPEVLALGVGALLVARSSRRRAGARWGAGAAVGERAGERVAVGVGERAGARVAVGAGERAGRAGAAVGAGALLGLSVAIGTWSLLLMPGVLMALPDWRQRARAICATAAVPALALLTSPLTVATPIARLPDVARGVISVRPVVGTWGWTALVTGGKLELQPTLGRVGTVLLVAGLLVAGYLWRRADPVVLTSALLLVFLLVSPRFGAQYLLWPIPFLLARPTRYTQHAIAAASVWAGFGYLFLGRQFTWLHDTVWYLGSWCVIPLLALALPWAWRSGAAKPSQRPAEEQAAPEVVTRPG